MHHTEEHENQDQDLMTFKHLYHFTDVSFVYLIAPSRWLKIGPACDHICSLYISCVFHVSFMSFHEMSFPDTSLHISFTTFRRAHVYDKTTIRVAGTYFLH